MAAFHAGLPAPVFNERRAETSGKTGGGMKRGQRLIFKKVGTTGAMVGEAGSNADIHQMGDGGAYIRHIQTSSHLTA